MHVQAGLVQVLMMTIHLRMGGAALCVQIHGDAALAGQGINQETLQLANVPHYSVGGSLHLVINNQAIHNTNDGHLTVFTLKYSPGRVHHSRRERPFLASLHRYRQAGLRPRPPCQWRSPRGRGQGHEDRPGVSQHLEEGRLRKLGECQCQGYRDLQFYL